MQEQIPAPLLAGIEPVSAALGPLQWQPPAARPRSHVVSAYEVALRMDLNHTVVMEACVRAAQTVGMRVDRQHIHSGVLVGTRVESLWHPTEWKWAHFTLSVSRQQFLWSGGQSVCIRTLCVQFIAEREPPSGLDRFFDRKDIEIASNRGRDRTATVLKSIAASLTEQEMLLVHTPDWDDYVLDPENNGVAQYEAHPVDSQTRPPQDGEQVLIELDEQFADALCGRCMQMAYERALETLQPLHEMRNTLANETAMLEILLQLPYQYASMELPAKPECLAQRPGNLELADVPVPPVSKRWLVRLRRNALMTSASGSSDDAPATVSTESVRFGAALFVAADNLCQQATEECDAQAENAAKSLVDQVKLDITATEAYRSELVRCIAEAAPTSWEKIKYAISPSTSLESSTDESLDHSPATAGSEAKGGEELGGKQDRFTLKHLSSFVAVRDRTDSEVTKTTAHAFEEAFGVCQEYIILDKQCLFSGSFGRLFITKTSLWIVAGLRNDKKKIIPISSIGEVEVAQGVTLAPSIAVRLLRKGEEHTIGFPGESRGYARTVELLIQELRKLTRGEEIETVVV